MSEARTRDPATLKGLSPGGSSCHRHHAVVSETGWRRRGGEDMGGRCRSTRHLCGSQSAVFFDARPREPATTGQPCARVHQERPVVIRRNLAFHAKWRRSRLCLRDHGVVLHLAPYPQAQAALHSQENRRVHRWGRDQLIQAAGCALPRRC